MQNIACYRYGTLKKNSITRSGKPNITVENRGLHLQSHQVQQKIDNQLKHHHKYGMYAYEGHRIYQKKVRNCQY